MTAARLMKPKDRVVKTAKAARLPAAPRQESAEQESGEIERPGAVIEAIFVALPKASPAGVAVPEVVRKNRRERAKRRLRDALETRGPYPIPEALLDELWQLVERWAHKGFDDAFAEADGFEIRCAEERAVLDAAARGDEEERFAAAERAHLRAVEERYGRIEIRGLQLSARVWQDLEIAYVPLHVEDRSEAMPAPKKAKKAAGKKLKGGASTADVEAMTSMLRALERPRVLATHALAKHSRLLIVGDPGSGKSTLVASLATRAARGEAGLDADRIPFVVPVRSLPEAAVTLETLADAGGAAPWFLEAALRRGRALLLIDGLDEARAELSGKVLPALTALLDAHPDNRVLVTSRPAGAPDTAEGGKEPGAQGFSVTRLVPMTREEVSTFIAQWCLAAELSLNKPRAQAEVDARAAADDLRERVRASRAIEKLAQTPLLCSVICVVHRFLGQRIPERRVALYEAITNVLLYEWDRAKFPESATLGKLDAHEKRALLARLALSMHEARVAELPAEEVVRQFAAHLPRLGRARGEAATIVSEIRDRNGVLVERSPGMFGFSHLTFQEYLAGMELVNAGAYDKLLRKYKDKWWHEVIVLAAGFPGAHAERLIRGLLAKDGDKVATGTMLAAHCAETAIEVRQSLRKQIEKRVETLAPPRDINDYGLLVELGDIAGPVLLRILEKAHPEDRGTILLLLGDIGYEPSIGAICRSLRDASPLRTIKILRPNGTWNNEAAGKPFVQTISVAECAAFAAASILESFNSPLTALLDAVPIADASAIKTSNYAAYPKEYATASLSVHELVHRYESAHAEPSPSPAPSPKRAARSG